MEPKEGKDEYIIILEEAERIYRKINHLLAEERIAMTKEKGISADIWFAIRTNIYTDLSEDYRKCPDGYYSHSKH